MIFFTSDTHFGHRKIIEYCARPFASVEEMNDELVRRWNARVRLGDTVYHLGDFALGSASLARRVLAELNGTKVLIRGNHDRSCASMVRLGFDAAYPELLAADGTTTVFLRHQPGVGHEAGVVPPGCDVMLCGHVHQRWARVGDQINVGVDVRDYEPKTLGELLSS